MLLENLQERINTSLDQFYLQKEFRAGSLSWGRREQLMQQGKVGLQELVRKESDRPGGGGMRQETRYRKISEHYCLQHQKAAQT